ncbi:FapA family protein [Alicyclobacillus tolerans]|uniref:FapA family protein n=1 Tax=Alicyclobacillus tolerans TaxID=90970 RepID=UPI001F4469A6|nr:FapA family protein [Alicyclobacillus tolerans]MCF8566127.1 FapA family protein [Alicyclobacillus tolerans]
MDVKDSEQVLLTVTNAGVDVPKFKDNAQAATLRILQHPHLTVRVNGKLAVGSFRIFGGERVQVDLSSEPAQRTATVEVSEDGMQAVLHIQYIPGTKRALKPVSQSAVATVEVVETSLFPLPFDLGEIRGILEQYRISFQVDYAAISSLLATGANGKCVCARGIPFVPPIAEHYEVVSSASAQTRLIGIVPVHPVSSAKAGEIVAIHHPAKAAIPGTNVRGEVVVPKAPNTRLQRLGDGVVEDDEGHVVAVRPGRIIFTPVSLDVAHTLIIDHDHKVSDGLIHFNGDVVVKGSVMTGVEIVATGRVSVNGSADHARIIADEGIQVDRGVFASSLSAGMRMRTLLQLRGLLQPLAAELELFIAAVSQVEQASQQHGLALRTGPIALKLLEGKFQSLLNVVDALKLWSEENAHSIGVEWLRFIQHATGELSFGRLTLADSTASWCRLQESLQEKLETLPEAADQGADVVVRTAQRSVLEASRDIVSTGQGFYQCQLRSGRAVEANGEPGVVLGCTVVAQTGVHAREVGSQAEVNTSIEIHDKEGQIVAKHIHPGTRLSISGWQHRVQKDMRNVKWP